MFANKKNPAPAAAKAAPAAKAAKPASEKKRKGNASDYSEAETPNFPQMSQVGKAPRSSNGAGKVPKKSEESLAIQKLKQELQDLYVKQKTNQKEMDGILATREFADAWDRYTEFKEADENLTAAFKDMKACDAYDNFMEKANLNNQGNPEDPIDVMRSASKFGKELEEQITDAKKRLLDQRDKEAIEAAAKEAAAKEAAAKEAAAKEAAAKEAAAKEAAAKEAADKEAADKKAARKAARKEAKEAAAKEAADKEAADKEAAAKEKLEANKAEERALMERLAQLRAEMPPLEAVAVEAVPVEPECSSPEGGPSAPKRTKKFTCDYCGAFNVGNMCKKNSCVNLRKAALRALREEKKAATYGPGSSNPHSSDSSEEDEK